LLKKVEQQACHCLLLAYVKSRSVFVFGVS
jgi:hypothetical protein